jgi:hypothetical protein
MEDHHVKDMLTTCHVSSWISSRFVTELPATSKTRGKAKASEDLFGEAQDDETSEGNADLPDSSDGDSDSAEEGKTTSAAAELSPAKKEMKRHIQAQHSDDMLRSRHPWRRGLHESTWNTIFDALMPGSILVVGAAQSVTGLALAAFIYNDKRFGLTKTP